MRLNIATDLVYVIRYAESRDNSGNFVIQDLFKSVNENQRIKKDY